MQNESEKMSGSTASTSAKGLLNKLIKNSNRQEGQYFSPRRMRSQFKTIESKKNLIKTTNEEAQVSSPFFQPNVTRLAGKKLKNINVPDSFSSIKLEPENKTVKLDSNNGNQDNNCELVRSVEENKFQISTEKACLLEYGKEHDDESKLNKKKRVHVKLELDQELNEELKVIGTKRELYPINPEIISKWEPCEWNTTLENIRSMRSEIPAPVDTMGCDKCADENADEKTIRFHKLVALMLSSQTRDEVTFQAMNRLKSQNLTPEHIVNISEKNLEVLLCPVSFYKRKTKALQNTSKILIEKYSSDIPETVDELMKLPGVGPKMAHICMKTAWNIVTGIGVDTHVHRIANRLKWVEKPTKTPEQTRKALESWLPEDLWAEVNHLLVGFGQSICIPIKPKCDQCLNNLTCPSAFNVVKIKKK